ncbi:MAG: GDSL-type esterase/lipase family protein [Clostridium sp.]|nr:GDSL-type esterase/lipase family protein [Clostridium sp.]
MKPRILAALLVAATLLCVRPVADAKTKVACIGNSITFGYGTADPSTDSYPSQLAVMLGDDFEVANFGRSGATLLADGHNPYTKSPQWRDALAFAPDIAVIHLGINDTDPRNWPNYADRFTTDYLALLDSLRAVNPDVRIILANLSPISATHHRFTTGTRLWRDMIRDRIADIATMTGLELIDFETPLIDHRDLCPDGLHPDRKGLGLMAEYVRGAITGDHGGLQLPPLYGNGMVLQRRRPVNIVGTADSGETVTVTLSGNGLNLTGTAVADNVGDWSVTLPATEAAEGLALTVSTPSRSLVFEDVAVGEVWLASGQSNMAFMVCEEETAADMIASASDSLLRFFNMVPRCFTTNAEWSAAELDSVNDLRYFLPARWQKANPQTVRNLSAIGYEFARILRDSLRDVPVAIINNPVGGAPAESYVERGILQHGLPGALVNWRRNDYVQPWVQGRADQNAPTTHNPNQRHPYEPSYLYSAGIRPLEGYTLAGTLWYQGESNAHNTELHEAIFPLVVESMRGAFGDPEMPFLMVQLSGIERPSWPLFRDSQRRLADSIAGVEMAVSFDYGDPRDVHPRRKIPVAERLSRIALNRVYGRDGLEYSGPKPLSAVARDSVVILTMTHADGLSTSDSAAPATFELAEFDGAWYTAVAEIGHNTVRLHAPGLRHPRYVRYAWLPYTDKANLINNSALPTSTFRMKVENINNPSPVATIVDIPGNPSAEKGIENGISAPFAGTLNGGTTFVVAGGCNFPDKDPFAPSAKKKTYAGIYRLDNPAEGRWTEFGTLPSPTAYGASLQGTDAILLAGGLDQNGHPTDRTILLTVTPDGKARLAEAEPLPATVDNPGFCSDTRTGYIVGGNVGGAPSNRAFAYDFASGKFTELPPMPGNPRVQPTAAVSGGKLYVWGGFAGKGEGREATLETAGLLYDPSTGRWSEISAPTDNDGEAVSLGGGVAATLSDGRVVATGGVNKDIFLEALRNQAPDYLSHEPSWYRFNGRVMVFDPATMVWTVAAEDSRCARAGAAIFPVGEDTLLLFGGEEKPRVRNPRAVEITL